jgi:hypothetical protein
MIHVSLVTTTRVRAGTLAARLYYLAANGCLQYYTWTLRRLGAAQSPVGPVCRSVRLAQPPGLIRSGNRPKYRSRHVGFIRRKTGPCPLTVLPSAEVRGPAGVAARRACSCPIQWLYLAANGCKTWPSEAVQHLADATMTMNL